MSRFAHCTTILAASKIARLLPLDDDGTRMTPLVRPLGTLSPEDRPLVGGKAASLGELIRHGFPVPDGFCVTCDAHRAHLGQGGLVERIRERVRGLAAASPEIDRAAREVAAGLSADSVSRRTPHHRRLGTRSYGCRSEEGRELAAP